MKLLNKCKEKLRIKIRGWLGIPEIVWDVSAVTKDVDMLKALVKCGVDVHMRQDSASWAVVCLAGKSEYVNFVKLDNKDARDIRDFLRNFKQRNTLLDMPSPSISRDMFWR